MTLRVLEPGGGDHARASVLQRAYGAGHHVTYTVDEPHRKGGPVLQRDFHSFLGDKFGFRSHDGAAGTALGQLVAGALSPVDVIDVRNDHGLHEAFDKGRLPRPHRPHHADIDISLGTQGDILVDLALFHLQFLLRPHEPVVFST